MTQSFDNILLLGRPASGKSEFIDFMKNRADSERMEKYHIGKLEEMDDFPWLWEKFMEDNIWEAAGASRKYSSGGDNPGLNEKGGPLFDFCMHKFNVEYKKRYHTNPDFFKKSTLFIEFARGGENAYHRALHMLSDAILGRAAILFILVSYQESCRRNEARYQEKLQHSILAHKVPDETMRLFYQTHDWLQLTEERESGYLMVRNHRVPFVTMGNEPELTDPKLLEKRYGTHLKKLMELAHAPL